MPLPRVTAVLLAAAVLAGCGAAEPTANVSGGRVAVELDDFLIRPQDITVRHGLVTFDVTNRGRLVHSFHVQAPDHQPVKVTRLHPGASASATANLAPGEYRLVCVESNHADLGMTGRLIVR